MKYVEATDNGYDGIQARAKGEKFHIREEAFDAHWMKDLSPNAKPEKPAAPASAEQPASPEAAPSESPAPQKARGKKKA